MGEFFFCCTVGGYVRQVGTAWYRLVGTESSRPQMTPANLPKATPGSPSTEGDFRHRYHEDRDWLKLAADVVTMRLRRCDVRLRRRTASLSGPWYPSLIYPLKCVKAPVRPLQGYLTNKFAKVKRCTVYLFSPIIKVFTILVTNISLPLLIFPYKLPCLESFLT